MSRKMLFSVYCLDLTGVHPNIHVLYLFFLRVVCLLAQLEAVFQHGFKKSRVSAFR